MGTPTVERRVSGSAPLQRRSSANTIGSPVASPISKRSADSPISQACQGLASSPLSRPSSTRVEPKSPDDIVSVMSSLRAARPRSAQVLRRSADVLSPHEEEGIVPEEEERKEESSEEVVREDETFFVAAPDAPASPERGRHSRTAYVRAQMRQQQAIEQQQADYVRAQQAEYMAAHQAAQEAEFVQQHMLMQEGFAQAQQATFMQMQQQMLVQQQTLFQQQILAQQQVLHRHYQPPLPGAAPGFQGYAAAGFAAPRFDGGLGRSAPPMAPQAALAQPTPGMLMATHHGACGAHHGACGAHHGAAPMAPMAPMVPMPMRPQEMLQETLPRGSVLGLVRDARACRQLQKEIEHMGAAMQLQICEEIAPALLELSTHPQANYVVSKLAPNAALHAPLSEALQGHVVELMVHPQGSRVVQAALKALPRGGAAMLVSELRGSSVRVAADTHGSWSAIVAYETTRASFMLAEISAELPHVATSSNGGRVAQAVLAAAAAAQLDLTDAGVALLKGDVPTLAAHPYANYVVQRALRHFAEPHRAALVVALLPRLVDLATSKHGSATAEATLQHAEQWQLAEAAEIVLAPTEPGCAPGLRRMLDSSFGNYVLQTLVKLSPPEAKARLLAAIRLASEGSNFGRIVLGNVDEPRRAPWPEFSPG